MAAGSSRNDEGIVEALSAMAQVLAHANFNNMFFSRIILVIYYMCLYVLLCDYLPLCVYYLGLVDFWSRIVI
ncbi:hypothetical protein MtrunA17_Chr6g0470921 [Medicago truncatula]|uniref:Transmembrane protein n=1 Tax=Medicago truncatula TaxID=3880 RepID=A0A396HL66_MEDTR|nr:hypothetical protein MtrunA17_Chr6g0470921 [Medicago truncatula]